MRFPSGRSSGTRPATLAVQSGVAGVGDGIADTVGVVEVATMIWWMRAVR